ncbi:MAG: YqaA family protein [bacterium]
MSEKETPKPNLIRQLYDWVLSWAESPYGSWALFGLSFAESSFFPIPPDVLLIALAISQRTRALKFALVCSVGSLLGGVFGYIIGYQFWSVAGDFFFSYVPGFTQTRFEQVKALYQQHDFLVVFTAGFTFIPYKIFTISSGVFDINFVGFLLASAVGRAARFFIVAGLIWKFGEPIKDFIDKYFNLLAFLFIILLIFGFFLVRHIL